MDQRVRAVIAFMDINLARKFTPTEIAQSVCLSAAHLRELFKEETGTSLARYRRELRLERAKHLYSVGRVQVVTLPEGTRYRVHIGQFSREAQAETAASHLESSLGLQAFVFRDDS